MAKNIPSKGTPAKTPAKSVAPAPIPAAKAPTTVTRNSPLPKTQASAPRAITHEMIAKRAYEIYVSGKGGSQYENWIRAERELKGV
ncbi:MAG: DUF2934 domain-containing protein [Planctomycetota bacterium]|nr:DUF2934 domain-containing protein [Planctomycetota bacterium]